MGVPMDPPAFVAAVQGLLGQVQDALLASASAFRDENIVDVSSYEELKAVVAEGQWLLRGWGRGGGGGGGEGMQLRGMCVGKRL